MVTGEVIKMDRRISSTDKNGRKWTVVGLVLSGLSIVLQGIGYSCPGWIVIVIYLHVIGDVLGSGVTGFGTITTAVSVWYGRVCLDGEYQDTPSCDTQTGHDPRFYGFRISTALDPLSDISWVRMKLWLTAGLYIGCVGTFLSALALIRRPKVSPKVLLFWATFCMLLSGALVIPAVVEVVLATRYADKAIDRQTDLTAHRLVKFESPWALIVTCAGVLLAAISAACLCAAACKRKHFKAKDYDVGFYDIGGADSDEHTRM